MSGPPSGPVYIRYLRLNASPRAAAMALVNRLQDITSDRMFLGALVNAYSRPVMEAKISLIATKMYLVEWFRASSDIDVTSEPLTLQIESKRSRVKRGVCHPRPCMLRPSSGTGSSISVG